MSFLRRVEDEIVNNPGQSPFVGVATLTTIVNKITIIQRVNGIATPK